MSVSDPTVVADSSVLLALEYIETDSDTKVVTPKRCHISIPREVAMEIGFFRDMLTDLAPSTEAIPLYGVAPHIVTMMVDFHEALTTATKTNALTDGDAPNWEDAFFQDRTDLDILQFANTTSSLLYSAATDAVVRKIQSMIRPLSIDEIRKRFNIVNDFTPAEEEAVWKANEWKEED
jgi:S-phase kinase-associated protein 1